MDKVVCELLFFQTGQDTLKIQEHVHHYTGKELTAAGGCGGTARTCSSHGVSGSRSG
ncbi:hypothetical protein HanRHA438_Chr03g0147001 [Helianthus annuus]|nr:hypothetical protein HanRHA438_Chr03g0147001 [Helianthus annuus]